MDVRYINHCSIFLVWYMPEHLWINTLLVRPADNSGQHPINSRHKEQETGNNRPMFKMKAYRWLVEFFCNYSV
jgi:hypothetical protein